MKVRNSFVTNSSSSSFLLAKKGRFTEEQKTRIADYFERHYIGKKIASTKEELVLYIKEEFGKDAIDDDGNMSPGKMGRTNYMNYSKAFQLLDEGMEIYGGEIDFEIPDFDVAGLHEDVWNMLEGDNFVGIDTDLSY